MAVQKSDFHLEAEMEKKGRGCSFFTLSLFFTQPEFSTIWIFTNVWHLIAMYSTFPSWWLKFIFPHWWLKFIFPQSSVEDFLKMDFQVPSYTKRQFFSIFYYFFLLLFLCSDSFFSLCFIVVFILFSCSVFFLPDVHIAESHINWLVLRAATGGFMGPCYMVIKFCWVMKHLYTCSCVLYILWVFWCSPGDWFLLLREHGKIVTMTEF